VTNEIIETDAGAARITWHRARKARLVLAVSHGAGGGIEARDLQALARALPGHGVTVALVEQPWRVAGKKLAPAPKTLDLGWRGIWPALAGPGLPVVSGGRSAGARVACRTATELGAHAVLALSFPLHPPGKPEKSRAAERKQVVVANPARDGEHEKIPGFLVEGIVENGTTACPTAHCPADTASMGQTSAGHTASDVPLSASGPGAWQFTGVYENTDVLLKMLRAATGSYARPDETASRQQPAAR
jgi:hypothetical protein